MTRAPVRLQVRLARLALCAGLAALPLVSCGPQPVDIKTALTFSGAQAKAALKEQMPPALLTAVGGQVPDQWPLTAPRLLLDVLVTSRAKIDLAGAGVDATRFSAVRLHSITAHTTQGASPFAPQPAEYLLFAGPTNPSSLYPVLRLARGAFPTAPSCTGRCPDAGAQQFSQTLELEPGARGGLQALLLAGQVELLLMLRVPVDTAVSALAPVGSIATALDVSLELAP
jgi:hypothetical protein